MTGASGSQRRIPSLDGLRAVSIGFVLFGHNQKAHPWAITPGFRPLLEMVSNADLGVSIFFVISGFLITTLLAREFEAAGGISLRDFYIRRIFRIVPAYYTFLLVVWSLTCVGVLAVPSDALRSSFLFLRNYVTPVEHSTDWYTAHCWSLSVEEQFYLFWPICLAVLGRRRGVWLSSGLIILAPLSRIATYVLWPDMRPEMNYLLHTRVDTLMWGCLAALLFDSLSFRAVRQRAYQIRIPLIAAFFLALASPWLRQKYQGVYLLTVGYGIEGACITVVMLWAIDRPAGLVGRALNYRPVMHLGAISYSVYLWQQLFTFCATPIFFAATFLAAEGSYWLIEKPFLAWRGRFTSRVSIGGNGGGVARGGTVEEATAIAPSEEGGPREFIHERAET